MQAESRAWFEGLQAFVRERRRTPPRAAAVRPAAERSAERAILAAHLVSWLDDFTAVMAARRRLAAAEPGQAIDPDPPLVLTTSADGIAVAEELVGGGHPLAAAEAWRIVAVTEPEYRLWCIRERDDARRHHLAHWNWLKTRVPRQRAAEFARHPLAAGEAWWLHRTGTAGAGSADRRDCHLWKWNGRQAVLVEAGIREDRVSHFVPPPDDRP